MATRRENRQALHAMCEAMDHLLKNAGEPIPPAGSRALIITTELWDWLNERLTMGRTTLKTFHKRQRQDELKRQAALAAAETNHANQPEPVVSTRSRGLR